MDFNPRQQEAVDYGNGPLLIIAGAGSGKTRTLTGRLLKFLAAGIPPERVCAITFTNKAAREMLDRVSSSANCELYANKRIRAFKTNPLIADGGVPFIGTFHSLGARILRREARRVGRTPAYSIFDADDALAVSKKALFSMRARKDEWNPVKLIRLISEIKNKLLAPGELLEEEGVRLFDRYEESLAGSNAFDFDDLIEKTVRLFRSSPETLARYRRRFTHILVDEYQDVNPAQYELVRLLAGEHRNLSVVGDDAQAIYGWRHADFRNFLAFTDDWRGAKEVKLEQNYRSTANIIRAASALIANNVFQKKKELWTAEGAGEPVRIVRADDSESEAYFIAEAIQQFPRSAASANKTKNSPPRQPADPAARSGPRLPHVKNQMERRDSTAAILYRTNAQSRAVEQALIERGIPYRIYGGVKFYERKEIKDIVAGLRLAANPKDMVAAERIEKTFTKAVGARLVHELPALGAKLPLLELISFFLMGADYFEYLKRKFRNAEERIENVKEFISFASEFTALQEFLERVSLLQSTDAPIPQSANRGGASGDELSSSAGAFNKSSRTQAVNSIVVQLMTIHLAKGLEFDRVFIAGASEGTLPHHLSYGTPEELEEERRLMYVAMTRARKQLCISFSNLPSRFLREIPPELADYADLSERTHSLSEDDNGIYLE